MFSLHDLWRARPQERQLSAKKREHAERVGVRSASDVETPDEKVEVAPGVEEGECCCLCGATEDLIYVEDDFAVEPES